jgi:hypothetical protein
VLTSLQHWLLNEQEFRRNPAVGEGECEFLCQKQTNASNDDI